MALAQDHLDAYAACYQKAVEKLTHVRASILLPSFLVRDKTDLVFPLSAPFRPRFPHRLRLLQSPHPMASDQAFETYAVLSTSR